MRQSLIICAVTILAVGVSAGRAQPAVGWFYIVFDESGDMVPSALSILGNGFPGQPDEALGEWYYYSGAGELDWWNQW